MLLWRTQPETSRDIARLFFGPKPPNAVGLVGAYPPGCLTRLKLDECFRLR